MTEHRPPPARGLSPALFAAAIFFAVGCDREVSGPIRQRGYLWQREWTPAIENAFVEAQTRLDGVTILGGEILWTGTTPRFAKSSIGWETVARSTKPCPLALRIAPFPGPFEDQTRFVVETATSLLAAAKEHGANVSEFQVDFDCAQKKLAGYRIWVKAVRAQIHPIPLIITTLPSWLDEPEFARLLSDADGYVLQVHSVPLLDASGALCDPDKAKAWVRKAAQLGRPFTVALPTYRCLGGYDSGGHLLGVAMDSVQPNWPRDTRVLEFSANALELSGLVHEWKTKRPASMSGVIWYRVPTTVDTRNWRWPTLAAVMEGRAPVPKLEVISEGENPIDLLLANSGEAEEQFTGTVTATWTKARLVASDALPDWTVQVANERALFSTANGDRLRLLPGERRAIGWLRYDEPAQPVLQLAETPTSTR